jgi:hypothetical protein
LKREVLEKELINTIAMSQNQFAIHIFITALVLCLFVSCQKDTDNINWSPTQALPADTTDNNENPIDTNQTQYFPFQWQAVLIGDEAFYGDSSTVQYVYDTLAAMHEFSCFDQFGRQMILRMPDLEVGDDTISFSNTTSITLIDGPLVFDTSFNPNGYISIYSNANGRISALFESDLNDNAGSGQEKELVNGIIQNIPYQ